MARKRMIDPCFWSDDKIIELSLSARLLFIGMWNFADDNGVIPNRPKQLKAQIFPADSITHEQINEELMSIHGIGLILFGNEGGLIKIKGWSDYQKINRPTPSKYEFVLDGSVSNHGGLTPNRIEDSIIEDSIDVQTKDNKDTLFEQFYDMYPRKVKKQRAYLAFRKLSKKDKETALEALPNHVKQWTAGSVEKEYIPHPSSWINGKQWEDEICSSHISDYKYDTVGFPIGYCERCGKGESYTKEEINGESRCHKARLLAVKPNGAYKQGTQLEKIYKEDTDKPDEVGRAKIKELLWDMKQQTKV